MFGLMLEMGEVPWCLPLQDSAPWHWAAGHCGHFMVWALCGVGTARRGHCPQCRQLRPGSLPRAHVLLSCSRSELSPLISAASLHTEEPGKDGVTPFTY